MADDADKPTPLNKNGKKSDGPSGSSFFTWFMIIALLGVWTSVAVVWFDLVDYEDVLAKAKEFRYNLSEVLQGKLGVYDADGDGDFDMEDAKVLLGLTKGDGNNDQIDTLEEVLDTIAEETSDWAYGFFSFLFDVMTPFEILEDEENEASKDVAEEEPGGKLKAKEKAKAKVETTLIELKRAKEKIQMSKEKKPTTIRATEEEKPKKTRRERAELNADTVKKAKPVRKIETKKEKGKKDKDEEGKGKLESKKKANKVDKEPKAVKKLQVKSKELKVLNRPLKKMKITTKEKDKGRRN
uniref:Aspartate beta-hydroxylase n=1 Tax=Callorhinchus milii TaxID=7868 RepID=A0A4W3JU58_CALMI